MQALTRPGDIIIDRRCHQVAPLRLVLADAMPDMPRRISAAAVRVYGAVPFTIKRALLDLEAAGQLHRIAHAVALCTFDGVVHNRAG